MALVANVALKYSGGGHIRAAGFMTAGTMEEIKKKLYPDLVAALKDE